MQKAPHPEDCLLLSSASNSNLTPLYLLLIGLPLKEATYHLNPADSQSEICSGLHSFSLSLSANVLGYIHFSCIFKTLPYPHELPFCLLLNYSQLLQNCSKIPKILSIPLFRIRCIECTRYNTDLGCGIK